MILNSYHLIHICSIRLNTFSKIKAGIRSRLRTNESGVLPELILAETQNITLSDIAGFFRYMQRNITNCAVELPFVS